jgi:GT2 family glycosyltransferase
MCYQHGDPPTRLPADLFEKLEPWLEHAREFVVLGGEPFVSKACLRWIERLTEDRFPGLGLAAITNGYGFSHATADLIRARRWSWILVSIDAASGDVYRRVRGGDFHVLEAGLQTLVEIRAEAAEPFELRFGFTLQRDNLPDALPFLDLCQDFNAVPQYTLVFGDWHEQALGQQQDGLLRATLEELDKELWARGFKSNWLGSVFGRRGVGGYRQMIPLPVHMHSSSEPAVSLEAAERLHRGSNVVMWYEPADTPMRVFLESVAHDSRGTLTCLPTPPPDPQIVTRIKSELGDIAYVRFGIPLADHSTEVERILSGQMLAGVIFYLPFWYEGQPVSALDYRTDIESARALVDRLGIPFLGGYADVRALGAADEDQAPAARTLLVKKARGTPEIAVVSAVLNGRELVGAFIQSLARQRLTVPWELILVDDGSTDGTLQNLIELAEGFPEGIGVQIHTLARSRPYRPGTFSFRAGVARQVGVNASRAPLVVFFDPDEVVGDGCLKELHHSWTRGFDVVLGDRVHGSAGAGSISTRAALYWHSTRYRALGNGIWWTSFYTGNAAVDRGALEKAGGFDPSFQYWGLDDTDLGYRLARSGARFWHTPRARVVHGPSPSGGGRRAGLSLGRSGSTWR